MYSLPQDAGASTANRIWAALLALMLVYDIVSLRVPNLLVYSSVLFAIASVTAVDSSLLLEALKGGIILLVAMYCVAVVGHGAMGMADVKVSAFIGCVLGFQGGAMSLLFGLAAAGGFAGIVLLFHLRDRKDVAPLTPFLAISAVVYMIIFGSVLTAIPG
jgi:prepilin signal peptidase PulO-like enzyme (type II secretory pathway)